IRASTGGGTICRRRPACSARSKLSSAARSSVATRTGTSGLSNHSSPSGSTATSSEMRLNAWLARAGVASRRGADELIKAGRVTVNGEPGRLNTFVSGDDRVELDGAPLVQERLAYVLLHKPSGVVTTARDPRGRPTVVELVRGAGVRVVPVGR